MLLISGDTGPSCQIEPVGRGIFMNRHDINAVSELRVKAMFGFVCIGLPHFQPIRYMSLRHTRLPVARAKMGSISSPMKPDGRPADPLLSSPRRLRRRNLPRVFGTLPPRLADRQGETRTLTGD